MCTNKSFAYQCVGSPEMQGNGPSLQLPALSSQAFSGRLPVRKSNTMGVLVLVRHAQSRWNCEHRFTGSSDVAITAQGVETARELGRRLAARLEGCRFDAAFVSTLRRTRQTLDAMVAGLAIDSIDTVATAALNERRFGLLEGLPKRQARRVFGRERIAAWRKSFTDPAPGGESLAATAERAIGFFDETVLTRLCNGDNIIVVAHGDSLRTLVMRLEQTDPQAILNLRIPTAGARLYSVDEDGNAARLEFAQAPPG